jgi:uncharacterized protein YecT (DUF1311 family)
MKKLIIYIALLIPFVSISQTKKDLDVFEKKYQDCLDNGVDMLGCTMNFYKQSDSLLNVVYKKVYTRLDSVNRAKLKYSQLSWLKKRDLEFKIFEKKFYDRGLGAEDNKMIILDKKAIYVFDRIYFLINYK